LFTNIINVARVDQIIKS